VDERPAQLQTIGAFASAAQLSIKALRLYETLGVLSPSWVDPTSGYRYYHPSQQQAAQLIRSLRQLEMPLATIRAVLEQDADGHNPTALINAYWQEHLRQTERMHAVVQQLFEYYKLPAALRGTQELSMTHTVTTESLAPMPVLSITQRVTIAALDETIQTNLRLLRQAIRTLSTAESDKPFGVYHGRITETEDGPLEVCVPVAALPVGTLPDGIEAKTLPAVRVACVTLRGDQASYPEVLKGYDAVVKWINAQGMHKAGSPREVWHSDPGPDVAMDVKWPFEG
jgi:DNA-binding transcriptional MerR regulator